MLEERQQFEARHRVKMNRRTEVLSVKVGEAEYPPQNQLPRDRGRVMPVPVLEVFPLAGFADQLLTCGGGFTVERVL